LPNGARRRQECRRGTQSACTAIFLQATFSRAFNAQRLPFQEIDTGLATKITVAPAIRVVIVFDATMVAIPVSGEELLAIVTRPDPMRAFVRRTRPVTFMPAIVPVNRVLIALYPQITSTRRRRTNRNDARRRWRSDADTDANLSAQRESATNQK
jgi:hypothetical protein